MGNTQSIKKINFEDMQTVMKNSELYLIINTLPLNEQNCLILGTLNADEEEQTINNLLKSNINAQIIVYGKNCNDETAIKKYNQLLSIGFYNILLYNGGLFEWILLQDIYGDDLFPTTKKELDILKFKPIKQLHFGLLTN
jgi:hypothetical protein